VSVADEIDALYALPPEEFTAARNELAKRAGDAEIRKLKRPSQAAAIVNRLVRARRKEVERLVEAGRTLRSAQARGEGVEEALRAERGVLAELVRLAGPEGAKTDAVVARVRATFQAAAADDDAAVQVLAARLDHELEPPGFAPLLAAAAAAGPPARTQSAAKAPARDRERERRERAEREDRLREARRELREAEQAERAAEHALRDAQKRVEEARAAVERAAR
jgi:hypothetical protein